MIRSKRSGVQRYLTRMMTIQKRSTWAENKKMA